MMARWSRLLAWRLVRWLAHRLGTPSDVPEVPTPDRLMRPDEVANLNTEAYLYGVNIGIDVGSDLTKAHMKHTLWEYVNKNL